MQVHAQALSAPAVRHRLVLAGIFLCAAAALLLGWRLFWFLTDDAYISFRYVSNSLLGHGYVWNAPPFRPVQGYTSFLWVVLLDVTWRVSGVPPPVSANILSLLFSGGTLALTSAMVLRVTAGTPFHAARAGFLALALLGILSNRTFLTWTSSGLETALFDFLLVLWVFLCLFRSPARLSWYWSLGATTLLLSLARPDGLIFAAAAIVLAGVNAGWRAAEGRGVIRAVVGMSPLLGIPALLVWQRLTYGSWMPNTYAAKVVSAWPGSGVRYAMSFVMEYALWVVLLVAAAAAARRLGEMVRSLRTGELGEAWFVRHAPPMFVVGALGLHFLYYTLVVGGDHFEYRVYTHLIALLPVGLIRALAGLRMPVRPALSVMALSVVLSWPIPWVHFGLTRHLDTRAATYKLFRPVAPAFPPIVRWYPAGFDRLQRWLIRHWVCVRHQEHKVFWQTQTARYPPREEQRSIPEERYPVFTTDSVGMPGWVFPHMAILDRKGLNDLVIARGRVRPTRRRQMAHERRPPPGYIECFEPNIHVTGGQVVAVRRKKPLTADDIRACETRWLD
jgi:arabinofuranosyltransferase